MEKKPTASKGSDSDFYLPRLNAFKWIASDSGCIYYYDLQDDRKIQKMQGMDARACELKEQTVQACAYPDAL